MSFKRRTRPSNAASLTEQSALPEGVRMSPNLGIPITSWGLRSIDTAIGGGLPIGSLTIVSEDHPSAYYRTLTAYVIAQGLHAGHAVAIASFDVSPQALLEQLPACSSREASASATSTAARSGMEEMKIAWRYHRNADPSTHIISGDSARSFAYDFDLSQKAGVPEKAPVSCLDRQTCSFSLSSILEKLDMHLRKAAQEKRFSRIVVQGLSRVYDAEPQGMGLTRFLCRLRALCRVYGCVAVATCARDVPYRLQAVTSDALLQLDTFDGRGAGAAGLGKEWLGVFVVKKAYRDGRGPSVRGKGDVWVFKRGRRKYTMERATAAPDDGEDDVTFDNDADLSSDIQRETNGSGSTGSSICSSKPGSNLDF